MREESQLERKGLLLGAAPILERGFRVRFAILSAALVMSCAAAAQKPDLHGGGAQPSLLENHKTTKVVLPGYHLAGATLTVEVRACEHGRRSIFSGGASAIASGQDLFASH